MDEKKKIVLMQISCLYMKYGIRSLTMDDVARELRISKKTLYSYFSDKNDLVKQFLSFHMAELGYKFVEIHRKKQNAIDALVDISILINRFLQSFNPALKYDLQKYHPDIWQLLMDYKRENIFQNVRENLVKGIRERLYRKDLNPEIIASVYVSRVETIMDKDSLDGPEVTNQELFNEVFRYHIYGICSRKGIEYYEKIMSKIE